MMHPSPHLNGLIIARTTTDRNDLVYLCQFISKGCIWLLVKYSLYDMTKNIDLKKYRQIIQRINGKFQIHPKKFQTGFDTSFSFLHPSFLGRKRKRVKNNQLSYKTGYNQNSPTKLTKVDSVCFYLRGPFAIYLSSYTLFKMTT